MLSPLNVPASAPPIFQCSSSTFPSLFPLPLCPALHFCAGSGRRWKMPHTKLPPEAPIGFLAELTLPSHLIFSHLVGTLYDGATFVNREAFWELPTLPQTGLHFRSAEWRRECCWETVVLPLLPMVPCRVGEGDFSRKSRVTSTSEFQGFAGPCLQCWSQAPRNLGQEPDSKTFGEIKLQGTCHSCCGAPPTNVPLWLSRWLSRWPSTPSSQPLRALC